jgi:hypothetical protein
MTVSSDRNPFAGLANDLSALRQDVLIIHTTALEVAGIMQRAERRARRRLATAITAATLFAAAAAHAVALSFRIAPLDAMAVAMLVAASTAMSILVILPWAAIVRRLVRLASKRTVR